MTNMKYILNKKQQQQHMRMLVPDVTGHQIKIPMTDVRYLFEFVFRGVSEMLPNNIGYCLYTTRT